MLFDEQSANFWIISHAIFCFNVNHDVLPLPGAVPDMKAQSSDYIKLQNVYKTKAREDIAEVLNTVRDLERELGRSESIDQREVEAFCKGAGFIKVIRGRPIQIARSGETLKWGEGAKAAGRMISQAITNTCA